MARGGEEGAHQSIMPGTRKRRESLSRSGNQCCNLFNNAAKSRLVTRLSHGRFIGRGEKTVRERVREGVGKPRLFPGDKSSRRERGERGREREVGDMGSGQGPPIKREHSERAQEVLLVAAAEDVPCQEPKGRPVQMPEC